MNRKREEGGRKVIQRLYEAGLLVAVVEREVGEAGRKGEKRLVEIAHELQMGNRRGEGVERLIEVQSNSESQERGRKVVEG